MAQNSEYFKSPWFHRTINSNGLKNNNLKFRKFWYFLNGYRVVILRMKNVLLRFLHFIKAFSMKTKHIRLSISILIFVLFPNLVLEIQRHQKMFARVLANRENTLLPHSIIESDFHHNLPVMKLSPSEDAFLSTWKEAFYQWLCFNFCLLRSFLPVMMLLFLPLKKSLSTTFIP